ncbi:MAG: hypothetical protein ACXAB7_13765 [Candidatus Kariarchaeaceae archaeon]
MVQIPRILLKRVLIYLIPIMIFLSVIIAVTGDTLGLSDSVSDGASNAKDGCKKPHG